jgi:hypothetical protein
MCIAQTTSFRSSERASGGWFYPGMAIAAILNSIAGFAPALLQHSRTKCYRNTGGGCPRGDLLRLASGLSGPDDAD